MDYDRFLEHLGQFGLWQIAVFTLSSLVSMATAMMTMQVCFYDIFAPQIAKMSLKLQLVPALFLCPLLRRSTEGTIFSSAEAEAEGLNKKSAEYESDKLQQGTLTLAKSAFSKAQGASSSTSCCSFFHVWKCQICYLLLKASFQKICLTIDYINLV